MRRFWLLSLLLWSRLVIAQGDVGATPLDQARQLMKDGLEREVPAPSQGKPEWPRAEGNRSAIPATSGDSAARRVEALSDRARSDASLRARALAEERSTAPDNQPGVSQSRTRAAKTVGPPPPARPRPPRP